MYPIFSLLQRDYISETLQVPTLSVVYCLQGPVPITQAPVRRLKCVRICSQGCRKAQKKVASTAYN